MTGQEPEHAVFDELAAGHALNALEPADEQRFRRHAEQCDRCQASLAGYRQVTAALAETAPPAEPSAQLGARILAAALADLGQPDRRPAVPATADDGPSRVVPLRRRTAQRWRKAAGIAAAVALIAGGGTWAGLAATASGSRLPAVCAHPHACPQVALIAEATHQVAATVMIRGGEVWMKPARMAANPAEDIYVLWQITGSHRPLAVGSFDVRPGAHTAVRIGALAASYHGTLAFAVSLEHGRTIPAAPSRVLALGEVS